MGFDTYISYSGLETYDKCQFEYALNYVERRSPPKEHDNRLGSVFGSTIGRVCESFYDNEAWRFDNPREFCETLAPLILEDVIRIETEGRVDSRGVKREGGVLRWAGEPGATYNAPKDIQEIERQLIDAIDTALFVIKQHRLLGKEVLTEARLDSTIRGFRFGGRPDFIILEQVGTGANLIVDGKGTRSLSRARQKKGLPAGNGAHKEQLLWYAGLMRMRLKRWPDRIGFVYWWDRDFSDWWDLVPAEVNQLFERAHEVSATIAERKRRLPMVTAELFPPNPSKKNCQYCDYRTVCEFAVYDKGAT